MSVPSAAHTCLRSMAGSLGFIAVSIKQGAALHACWNFANVGRSRGTVLISRLYMEPWKGLQVSELTSCWHRAFRLDIQQVRGDHADGVHLAGLALHAHSLVSAYGGACCAWQPAKTQP